MDHVAGSYLKLDLKKIICNRAGTHGKANTRYNHHYNHKVGRQNANPIKTPAFTCI